MLIGQQQRQQQQHQQQPQAGSRVRLMLLVLQVGRLFGQDWKIGQIFQTFFTLSWRLIY